MTAACKGRYSDGIYFFCFLLQIEDVEPFPGKENTTSEKMLGGTWLEMSQQQVLNPPPHAKLRIMQKDGQAAQEKH